MMRQRAAVLGVAGAVVLMGGLFLYFFGGGTPVRVARDTAQGSVDGASTPDIPAANAAKNPLTGEVCPEGGRRPFAVMLAADHIARPLYGLAEADIVVEVPALTGGITRFMGVFACGQPEQVGSVRSARHDFLPFAKSFDAIFAHWGGSNFALDILAKKVVDNIDSIPNPYDAFWRRSDRAMPHNGFTSFARLLAAAQKLGYRTDMSEAAGYTHIKDEPTFSADQNLVIGYPKPYNVTFAYDHGTNSYRRFRGNEKEMDESIRRQVEVKNVIVMVAPSRQINVEYNEVDIEGSGPVAVYRNGEVIKGTWKRATETYGKGSEDDKYYFLDGKGNEIGLVPGKIWISVVEPTQQVELTFK